MAWNNAVPNPVSQKNCQIAAEQNFDNARNGLPDWWEMQHGLDPLTANADLNPEHDGLSNLLEYAVGGNPKITDAFERGMRAGRVEANEKTFLSLGFYRRLGDSSLSLRVQESLNLGAWSNLNLSQQMIGDPDHTRTLKSLMLQSTTAAGVPVRWCIRLNHRVNR